jgi:hypothetical protein
MTFNRLSEAIRLIQMTPSYTEVGVHLAQLASEGRIRVDPDLPDRAEAGLFGTITLGPEGARPVRYRWRRRSFMKLTTCIRIRC